MQTQTYEEQIIETFELCSEAHFDGECDLCPGQDACTSYYSSIIRRHGEFARADIDEIETHLAEFCIGCHTQH